MPEFDITKETPLGCRVVLSEFGRERNIVARGPTTGKFLGFERGDHSRIKVVKDGSHCPQTYHVSFWAEQP